LTRAKLLSNKKAMTQTAPLKISGKIIWLSLPLSQETRSFTRLWRFSAPVASQLRCIVDAGSWRCRCGGVERILGAPAFGAIISSMCWSTTRRGSFRQLSFLLSESVPPRVSICANRRLRSPTAAAWWRWYRTAIGRSMNGRCECGLVLPATVCPSWCRRHGLDVLTLCGFSTSRPDLFQPPQGIDGTSRIARSTPLCDHVRSSERSTARLTGSRPLLGGCCAGGRRSLRASAKQLRSRHD